MGAYPLLEAKKPIVFFDAECLLCNKLVMVLLKFDKNQQFVIASVTSEVGLFIQSKFNITEDTIVLFYLGKCHTKSNAFLAICKLLGFPYKIMTVFYLVPTFFRNGLYDIIARNRKRWFGTTDECLLLAENSPRIIR